jgi:hypothetical protein
MSEGFFLVHRGWRECPLFQGEFSRGDAWIWLIEHAAWKPAKARIKGSFVDLERGELSFSQRFLAEKWGWSKSRVDRFIADLRAEGMIETRSKIGANSDHKAGHGQSIIKLCNYEKYQARAIAERGNDEPESGASAGQQRGKEEQRNNKPLPNGNGAADFWACAVAYLGESRRSVIGKWRRDYSEGEVLLAVHAAQAVNAVDPVSYIEKTLRRQKAEAEETPVC